LLLGDGKSVKVQIFEQFLGGHHTNYIQALLPSLVELLEAKLIKQVVVTITREHFESAPFQQQLVGFSNQVEFDPSLPFVNPAVTMKGRAEIAKNLVHSVQQVQPDYLICPSADQESLIFALKSWVGMPTLPRQLQTIGIIHAGYPGIAAQWSDRIKDQIYRFSWRHSPWSRILTVNPIIYEWILRRDNALAKRTRMLPDPVPAIQQLSKPVARKRLNIPVDGRYVGYVGTMDDRKAIPELLAAFRSATLAPTDRLLLAGYIYPAYRELIQSRYADLLKAERLIVLDRYLNLDEVAAGFCALDVVSVLHYPRPSLSANLLKAIAANRPVVVDAFGYAGMMANRFRIGQACDVRNHSALVSMLQKSLADSATYHMTERTMRLLEFHQPQNFANTVLHDLYTQIDPNLSPHLKNWEWVNAGRLYSS
jgi:glycosyltransferase involved in cell wall biosynthesis